MLITGSLLLIIAPYIIGAALYARVVISEVKKLEEDDWIKQKEYEAKRNAMLSDIAHDLRTPITTISGYCQAISDGMVPEEKNRNI